VLTRFADTDLRRRLGAARVVRREVEYVASSGECESDPGVAGEIACLWQDETERWNLLYWVTESASAPARQAYFREREPELVLAASSLRAQMGDWPRSVALVFLLDNEVIERTASRLPHRSLLAEAARGLRGIAARPVM
jgi:hypothetical protein